MKNAYQRYRDVVHHNTLLLNLVVLFLLQIRMVTELYGHEWRGGLDLVMLGILIETYTSHPRAREEVVLAAHVVGTIYSMLLTLHTLHIYTSQEIYDLGMSLVCISNLANAELSDMPRPILLACRWISITAVILFLGNIVL